MICNIWRRISRFITKYVRYYTIFFYGEVLEDFFTKYVKFYDLEYKRFTRFYTICWDLFEVLEDIKVVYGILS